MIDAIRLARRSGLDVDDASRWRRGEWVSPKLRVLLARAAAVFMREIHSRRPRPVVSAPAAPTENLAERIAQPADVSIAEARDALVNGAPNTPTGARIWRDIVLLRKKHANAS